MNSLEEKWYELVRQTIAEHPEWLATTNAALTDGIRDRLDEEIQYRSNAETALCICFDHAKDIPENQVTLVKTAIKNSLLVGGTGYARKL